MKRVLSILLCLMLCIPAAAAFAEESSAVAQGFGGEVRVTVSVQNGKIISVTATGENETPGVGSRAIEQLPKMILAAQSADIDALSGCTVSSNAVLKAAKEAIIAEAEEIKDSTAWVETSRKFNELMDRWKKAGRAGRRDDDALWARFRAAADTFFNARQADREQISSSEKENLAKKEELLTKAEALVPVKDEKAAKQARQELAAIQEEWDQIGYVPRDDMHRIESRLDAVDKQIKAVEDAAWKQSDPEADARKSSFEEQLNAQLAELDAQIAAESDPKKKAKLEAEKATKEQWLNAIK